MRAMIYEEFRSKFPEPKEGDLRVWWTPQVPCEAFNWTVSDLTQAALLLDVLAAYDDFQFTYQIKGDYCNAGGLEIFEDGNWCDWHSPEDEEFDEYRERIASKLGEKS